MTFQQKRSLVSLIAIGVATVGYIARTMQAPPESPLEAAPLLIGGAVGLTVTIILAHTILGIGAGVEEMRRPAGEAERRIRGAARRNSIGVLAIGLVLVVGLALISAPPIALLQAGVAAFVLAEMARHGSELFYGRQAA